MADKLGDILSSKLYIGTEEKTKSEDNGPLEEKPKVNKKLTSKEKLKKLWKMRMQWERSNDYPENKSKKSSVFEGVQISSPGVRKNNFSICEDLVKQFREKEAEKVKQLWRMRLEWEEENSVTVKKCNELQGLEKSSTKEMLASQPRRYIPMDKHVMFNSLGVMQTRKKEDNDAILCESEKQKSISTLINKFLAPKVHDKQIIKSLRTKCQSPKVNYVEDSLYSLIKKGINAELSENNNSIKAAIKKSLQTKKSTEKKGSNVETFSPAEKKASKCQKPSLTDGSHMNKSVSVPQQERITLEELGLVESDRRRKGSFPKKNVPSRRLVVEKSNPTTNEPLNVNYSRKCNMTATTIQVNTQNVEEQTTDRFIRSFPRHGNHKGKQNSDLNYVAMTFPESGKCRSKSGDHKKKLYLNKF